jgi:proteasome lid subunit RPN8/RPN11
MLCIPYERQRELREAAEAAYPREACGILLGRREQSGDVVARVIACRNVDAEPERRYSLDPRELILTQREAREQGLEILGFYHSHPDHAAKPSEADLREAQWTGCVYVICEVAQGKMRELAAVRLVGPEQWAEEKVRVEPAQ